jgi:hypothetical protein
METKQLRPRSIPTDPEEQGGLPETALAEEIGDRDLFPETNRPSPAIS